MKQTSLITFFLITSFALSGCGEKIYTVTEFAENEELRMEWIEKCNDNPGEMRSHPNCENAFAGHREAATNELLRRGEERLRQIEEENKNSD